MILPRFYFHSSQTGRAADRWAATGGTPSMLLRSDKNETRLLDLPGGHCLRSWRDPMDAIQWLGAESLQTPGRWAGYLSYDLAYRLESIGTSAVDDLHLPLFAFAFFPRTQTQNEIPEPPPSAPAGGEVISSFSRDNYEQAVEQAKAYIAAGDVFQINLSQRFTIPTPLSAIQIYQRLQRDSPAAYAAMLDFGDVALVSNSPELFLRVEPNRQIITRPIKGTRPRLPGMERELRDSVKDQAELNMIVDLERNDLGRICEIGSVCVTQPRTIEAHPTIYHGVATIEGLLRPNIQFSQIIAAMFPGGSVTGAPKIRAMQLIDQMEPIRRGPYCGAIGYLDSDGSMQFNLAIRTMILQSGHAHISVGGGIVADSIASDEYNETLVKAQAMFRALGIPTIPKSPRIAIPESH